MTEIVPLDESGLERAASLLRAGRLVAFPTETVYGLGADAGDDKAVARIFEAKGRPRFNPLIVHLPSLALVEKYVELTPLACRLADAFWPGALTLVLKRKPRARLSKLVSAGLETVAVRVPAHGGARDLLRLADRPIAAPSANRSGRLSPTQARHVAESLGNAVDLILDGGACKVGLESTVVDATGETPTLLRPGGIAAEAIEGIAGTRLAVAVGDDHTPASPGMLTSHYAPGLPIRLDATAPRFGEAFLGFGPTRDGEAASLSREGDLVEAAANLFRLLHAFDDAARYEGIAVAPIPEIGLGRAINDRLRRAAA